MNLNTPNFNFDGKVATQITTSKHFYDITAHQFIKENALDLGFNFITGLSADMEDLIKKSGQQEAENFFKRVLWCTENSLFDSVPLSIEERNRKFSEKTTKPINFIHEYKIETENDNSKEIVIVTDVDNSNPKDSKSKIQFKGFKFTSPTYM